MQSTHWIARTAVLLAAAAVCRGGELGVLLGSYLQYEFAERATTEGLAMGNGLPAQDAQAIQDALDAWKSAQGMRVRNGLERQFGNEAQQRFGTFVSGFVQAEREGDAAYLRAMAGAIGVNPPPADYRSLREAAANGLLSEDLKASAWFLGSVESWAKWRREGRQPPPLTVWLTRNAPAKATPPSAATPRTRTSAPKPQPPPDAISALAQAEAAPQMVLPAEDEEAPVSPLAAYDQLVKQKREQMFKDAKAAAEQLETQRKEWEEDYATKKTQQAEAEAEAYKKWSEAMAQADKDALEQRQNSWQAKLKGIAGALVSSTVGAFTGGVGTRAGEKLAKAIFDEDDD